MSDESRPDIARARGRHEAAPESRAFAPLAAAYRAAGDAETAARVLEDGLVQHPHYVSGWVLLGECQRELGDDERAESTFARVLDLDADNLVALRFRALRAYRRGAFDRAVDGLRRAMELDPFDRNVQADLGLVTAALDRQSRERAAGLVQPAASALPASAMPPPPSAAAAPPAFAPEPPPPAPVVPPAAPEPEPEWMPPWIEPSPTATAAPPPAAPPPLAMPEAPLWTRETAGAEAPPARAERPPSRVEPPPAEWGRQPPAAWPPAESPEPVDPGFELDRPIVVRGRDPFDQAPPPARAVPPPPPPPPPRAHDLDAGDEDAPLPPPPIDLRRVGQAEPPPAPAEAPPAAAEKPPWRFTRQEDRIVVAPADAPVRGPIRSVEDRLFASQRGPAWPEDAGTRDVDVPAGTEPAPVAEPGAAATEAAAGRDFATLTLAGIYESQGYLHKALAIYDALQRLHPNDATVAAKLAALQRRLAGMEPAPAPARPPAPGVPPPAAPAPPLPAAEESVAWRLLDTATLGDPSDTAARLRRATLDVRAQAETRRHDVHVAPPAAAPPSSTAATPPPSAPVPPPPPAEPTRGHADYERFLQYLRSLKP